MGKRDTDHRKAGANARRESKQTRRESKRKPRATLMGFVYLLIVAVCVGALAMMPVINRAPDRQNTWLLQERRLEAAARAASANGGVRSTAVADADGEPVEPDTAAGESASDGEPMEPEAASGEPASDGASDGTDEIDEIDVAHLFTGSDAIADPAARTEAVTITVTAAGDCTLGGSVNQDTYRRFKAVVRKAGYDYFFEKVRDIFAADDLTILNLEGPLTDVGQKRSGSYCFKGDPDFVQILSGSSVELCNLANNHSTDFGVDGMKRTAEVLEAAGVGSCGYTRVYNAVVKGVRVTALGFDKWHNDASGIVEAIRRERGNCDLLIVNMHWGVEKHFEPMADQVKWGHAAIDAGADLVIGTHPHVYGGIELYKGKYIAYSLGNFCFGGNDNPTDKRCMMFQQTFSVSPDGEVVDAGINVIPCYVSGRMDVNNLQPVVMDAKDGTGLLKAIAKYSNFSQDDTLWMPGSYPEQVGLLPKTEENLPAGGGAGEART